MIKGWKKSPLPFMQSLNLAELRRVRYLLKVSKRRWHTYREPFVGMDVRRKGQIKRARELVFLRNGVWL